MAKKTYRLQKRVGSKARILKPYKIKKTGFEDIGLYARFPWHQTYLDPFVGGWSVALNHPCFNQEVWNTRTIPVIGVNDINSGIIDLAFCLLYIPYNFKMTVKNAIHCQGLWNECRDKALLDRFRSALRFYYSLEANFHKKEFEEGIRKFYENEASYGGSARGFWIRQNMNRQLGQQLRGVPPEEIENGLKKWYEDGAAFAGGKTTGEQRHKYFGYRVNSSSMPVIRSGNQLEDVPVEAIEEGLRQWYRSHMAWDLKGEKFSHQVTSTRRPVTDLIPDTDERALEEGLRGYYHKTHAFGGKENFQWDINQNAGSLHHGEPLGPEMEDALRSWYLSQHSYGSRKAFRFSQNEQRNMNVGSERKNRDYYDEIHGRLRWMQIFNEDFARNFKRFIGKMDHGFIYGDPTYFKTLTGKHYEDVLTLEQHQELADILHEADKTNTKFLLSYDVDERVDKLYSSFDFETIQVPYSVARSYGDGRAQMDEEYLIRNYNLKEDPYMKKVDFTKKTKLDQFMTGN